MRATFYKKESQCDGRQQTSKPARRLETLRRGMARRITDLGQAKHKSGHDRVHGQFKVSTPSFRGSVGKEMKDGGIDLDEVSKLLVHLNANAVSVAR